MLNFTSRNDMEYWFWILLILNSILFLIGLGIGFLEGYKYRRFCGQKNINPTKEDKDGN